jgi:6-phosphogluconolactonase
MGNRRLGGSAIDHRQPSTVNPGVRVFDGLEPASLFPNSAALDERTAWVVPNFVPELDAFRITLTFPVLNAAANVIFVVSGEDKAEIVHQVLEGPEGRFPAQNIQPTNGRLSWFLDKGAAQKLGRQWIVNRGQTTA